MVYVKFSLEETTSPIILFSDSDIVFSPSAMDFDIAAFAKDQGGYLSGYSELMTRGTTPGVEIISQLALEHSINPRILLTLMEHGSGWVRGQPITNEQKQFPMGPIRVDRKGVYQGVGWVIRQISTGYYGWRAGTLTEITYKDGSTKRLSPFLNAGTVAVMYTLSQIYSAEEWDFALYGEQNIITIHHMLFGDPRERVQSVEPLFPAGTVQPELNFPFLPNQRWALTNGPHPAWGLYGPRAALDFAPAGISGCNASNRLATAAAAGLVVRSNNSIVVLDLDGDGHEQTGWVLIYNHIANKDRVQVGDYLNVDEPVGYPSCEGGNATGTHVHIVRKFNGEWVLADGGLPFNLSGYRAFNGEKDCTGDRFCQGFLDNGEHIIVADAYGNAGTITVRPENPVEIHSTPTS